MPDISRLYDMSPEIKERFDELVAQGVIWFQHGECYFHDKHDPYAERPRSVVAIVEYATWNLAASTYRKGR